MVFRENFNGMYRTDAFFFAKQVVEMPLYIIEATIMFTIIYWIANLNPEAERFFIALGIIILILQVVFSLGYFLSCTLPTVDIALAIAPVLIIPMMLFGGFYLNSSSVVVWLAWIKYVILPSNYHEEMFKSSLIGQVHLLVLLWLLCASS